jgi:hypothetical protein
MNRHSEAEGSQIRSWPVLLAYLHTMQRWLPITWCGLLLTAACGGSSASQADDLCERLANPPDKQGNCPPLAVTITDFDETKCNMALASCSDEDEKSITALADCYAALPVCVRGDELAFTSRIAVCQSGVLVSNQCGMVLQAATGSRAKADRVAHPRPSRRYSYEIPRKRNP